MSTALTIPADYGYVILSFLLSVVLNLWLGFRVGGARKKYGVEYPALYHVTIKDNKIDQNNVFNCFQRAHQNFLEQYPGMTVMLLLAGLKHPRISAGLFAVWVVGRVLYAIGYSTGNPKNRSWGSPLIITTLLPLFFLSIHTGLTMIGVLA